MLSYSVILLRIQIVIQRIGGLSNEVYKQIINALETMERAIVTELKQILLGAIPAILDDQQQSKKVSNILQAMKREGMADVDGTGHATRWYLKKQVFELNQIT